jgi:hypothetical protein
MSAFTFYRGAAAIMAADLAATPDSGIVVQACGDAHISNFGGFAVPDRRLVFGPNDFDETLPGPWEWDVEQMAASVEIAGRDVGLPAGRRRRLVAAACGSTPRGCAGLRTSATVRSGMTDSPRANWLITLAGGWARRAGFFSRSRSSRRGERRACEVAAVPGVCVPCRRVAHGRRRLWGRTANMITTCASVAKPKPAMNACETASANAWAVAWSECCSARPNRRLAMGAAPAQGLPFPAPSRSGLQQMTPGRACNQPRPTVNSWNADHFVGRLQ